ncbi:uncharacterized protein M6B38_337395 [Iris pallida]|uniref:Uncharacterized protein n=1 Tax=Iris pallida TaxID=29817 RepID=A0AAX6H0E7_IRIPA|nr:uncharacterized protein M6B38_337395 [Iris pallida]
MRSSATFLSHSISVKKSTHEKGERGLKKQGKGKGKEGKCSPRLDAGPEVRGAAKGSRWCSWAGEWRFSRPAELATAAERASSARRPGLRRGGAAHYARFVEAPAEERERRRGAGFSSAEPKMATEELWGRATGCSTRRSGGARWGNAGCLSLALATEGRRKQTSITEQHLRPRETEKQWWHAVLARAGDGDGTRRSATGRANAGGGRELGGKRRSVTRPLRRISATSDQAVSSSTMSRRGSRRGK